jgi:excisionase family DNA binding protein
MKAKASMSIKELAERLGVSPDTVRRAARSGLIPSTREGTAYRFDWEKVRQAMRTRAQEVASRRSMRASAPDGESRPRTGQRPRCGNTGALTTVVITGVLSVR